MKKKKPGKFLFSVVAGELKGKRITAPDLGLTRPPLTRLRKAIFDFLKPYLVDAAYLDLFSGTGSYLFEAVSRGAAGATGVELEKQLADAINTQAGKLGVAERLICLCDDVFKAIPRLAVQKREFDIIMIAPPQYKGLIDRTLAALTTSKIIRPDGLILCQHDTSETTKINFGAADIWQRRKYGNTTYTVIRPLQ
jgi:16S rRNA (guanine(966)-N(2))-methyltransferase RsmD